MLRRIKSYLRVRGKKEMEGVLAVRIECTGLTEPGCRYGL